MPVVGWIILAAAAVVGGIIGGVVAAKNASARRKSAAYGLQLMQNETTPNGAGFAKLEELCNSVCAYITDALSDVTVWELPRDPDDASKIENGITWPMMLATGKLLYAKTEDGNIKLATSPWTATDTPAILKSTSIAAPVTDFRACKKADAIYHDAECELYYVAFAFGDDSIDIETAPKYLLQCNGRVRRIERKIENAIKDALEHIL